MSTTKICWWIAVGGVGVLALGGAVSAQGPAPEVTFTRDVAPILQQKCQVCHQPDSIGPMSLLTYADAKQYAGRIKAKVTSRLMPPWHIDKALGIQQFKNDRSLTDDQIATIARWVDGGMPQGDAKDLPPPLPSHPTDRWQLADVLGEPDLVIESPAYTLAAHTMDKWFRPVSETGLTEPRWVRAIEIKPAGRDGRRTVHHVLAMLDQKEDGVTGLAESAHDHQAGAGLFMEWAVGKTGQIFPADAGKLMLPASKIRWEIHMFAVGEEIRNNRVQLGVYFYPKGVLPAHRTVLKMYNAAPGSHLDIPPDKTAVTQNFYVLPAPARLENFQPHMHMRGKSMSMEAIAPDGRRQVLSVVNNFQWNWHVNYVYADEVAPLLPKGTVLVFTAWHDNTDANPNNPDPRQWVGWGDRTVDEMAHCWVDVTYLEQAEFDKLVAARKPASSETRKP